MSLFDLLRFSNPYNHLSELNAHYPELMKYWVTLPCKNSPEDEKELKELLLKWNTDEWKI